MTYSPANHSNPFRQSAALWVTEVSLPYRYTETVSDYLADLAASMTLFAIEEGPDVEPRADDLWKISLYSTAKPDEVMLEVRLQLLAASLQMPMPAWQVTYLEDHDWVSEVQKNFPPIRAGRFFIHGQHYEETPPLSTIPLVIDAGRAFGTGEHHTTSGCLEAISWLAKSRRFTHMLDMGCGSGILAIAMEKTWNGSVTACDIDPQSVITTRINALNNRARLHSVVSNGYKASFIATQGPYDLIMANILARPLMRFAADLAAHLAPGGIAVLSGLLGRQERMVLAAHRYHGLALKKRFISSDWHTLVLGNQ